MSCCPKCCRPFNEGNSPNAEECNGPDDDEGLCEAYAKISKLREGLESIANGGEPAAAIARMTLNEYQ